MLVMWKHTKLVLRQVHTSEFDVSPLVYWFTIDYTSLATL